MGLTADSGEPNGKREVCRMVALDDKFELYVRGRYEKKDTAGKTDTSHKYMMFSYFRQFK